MSLEDISQFVDGDGVADGGDLAGHHLGGQRDLGGACGGGGGVAGLGRAGGGVVFAR